MKVEDTKIYAVLKEVFEGTPEWCSVVANLSTTIDQFGVYFRDKEQLSSCFIWDDTYQGHGYWSDIDTKIKVFNNVKGLKMKEKKKKEEAKLVSMDKQYTRNGKKVRVLCVDRPINDPVVVMGEDGGFLYFTKYGKSRGLQDFDLKEYSPWQDVAVDTKVIVKFFDEKEYPRHFSHYKDGFVHVFIDGNTSFTTTYTTNVSSARLA